jgi:hypothetical protein
VVYEADLEFTSWTRRCIRQVRPPAALRSPRVRRIHARTKRAQPFCGFSAQSPPTARKRAPRRACASAAAAHAGCLVGRAIAQADIILLLGCSSDRAPVSAFETSLQPLLSRSNARKVRLRHCRKEFVVCMHARTFVRMVGRLVVCLYVSMYSHVCIYV